MKVSIPNDNNKAPKKINFEGILPLVDEQETKQLKKGTYSTFHLHTDPSDNTSPTYDFVVPYYLYGTSTVRQAIQFRKKMNRVISGLNITTSAGKKNVIEQMLKDTLQALYTGSIKRDLDRQFAERQASAGTTAAVTAVTRPATNMQALTAGWQAVMGYLAPPKALLSCLVASSATCVATVARSQRT